MQQYDRGYRRNALWQMSPVNTLIIVINVLVFAGLSFLGDTTDVRFMYNHLALQYRFSPLHRLILPMNF